MPENDFDLSDIIWRHRVRQAVNKKKGDFESILIQNEIRDRKEAIQKKERSVRSEVNYALYRLASRKLISGLNEIDSPNSHPEE